MLLFTSFTFNGFLRTFNAVQRNVVFYWHSREMSGLAFLALVAGVVATLAILVYFAIAGHDRSREVRARSQDLTCLAKNVYYEARGEPIDGQYAVAEVTLNRVASKHYPNTVCDVVYQERFDVIRRRNVSAFSWTELDVTPPVNQELWERAWKVAEEVYDKKAKPRVKGALFYHSRHVRPRWARRKRPIATIGNHVFY